MQILDHPASGRHEICQDEEARSLHALSLIRAAIELLAQGRQMLDQLTPAQYSAKSAVVFNGSIGGHYRHCLDHFICFLKLKQSDAIDYDARERNPSVETLPESAIHLTLEIIKELRSISSADLYKPIKARCEISYSTHEAPPTDTTGARELVYSIAHAIHHFALIRVIANLLSVPLPASFGVAPSTATHQAKIAAAS